MSDHYYLGTIRKTPTWHVKERLSGGVFDGNLTATQAVERAYMNYGYWKTPVLAMVNGAIRPVEGRQLIVRGKTHLDNFESIMSTVVSDSYSLMQISEMAAIVDDLIPASEHKAEWPLEHACVLKSGQLVIFLLEIGEYNVADDPRQKHKVYLCYSNPYDGVSAGKMFICTVRVVCWNTFSQATLSAPAQLFHRGADASYHRAVADMIVATEKAKAKEEEWMNRLATTEIDREALADFLEHAFQSPKAPSILQYEDNVAHLNADSGSEFRSRIASAQKRLDYEERRVKDMRMEAALKYGEFNRGDDAAYARTAYAAFNAVTATVTHSPKFQTTEMIAAVTQPVKTQPVDRAVSWLKDFCKTEGSK